MFEHCDKERGAKLERLYSKYKLLLLSEAYSILYDRVEAEDAVQQAFMKLSYCVDRIQEDNPGMTCNFLKVVTRNVAKDLYKKKYYLSAEEDLATYVADVKPNKPSDAAQEVIHKDSYHRIVNAIMSLPEIYRDILLIEKVYGYSREESMKILNANYETLKKRLTRAKAKLLEVLREEELDDGREESRKIIR